MQGPQGGKEQPPRDRSSTSSFRLSELNGRQPVVPQRPANMTRIDPPPTTPRVARPQRRDPKIRKPRTLRWWLGRLVGLVVLGIVVAVVAYGITNFVIAYNVSSGSGAVATDFLSSLQTASYDQAYNDLDVTLTTGDLTRSVFKQKALADDRCYGQVTDYTLVDNDTVSTTIGGVQVFSYTYTITRSKLKQTYPLVLIVQKDTSGDWFVTGYGSGNDPGPNQAGASC